MTTSMTSLNKIGILGGMFNPPTNAHMQMAIEAINRGFINEVWFVPSGNDSQDENKQLDANIRLEMVRLAVKDFFNQEFPIKVCDLEVINGKSIPTYDLMNYFIENKKSDEEFYFMMGYDLLESIQSWENSEKLINDVPFLIFKNAQCEINNSLLPKIYQIINTTFVATNSTEIRQRIKRNLNEKKDKFSNTSFSKLNKLPKKLLTQSGRMAQNEQQYSSFSLKYLGIYGLIPTSIINFIKENKIYMD